MNTINTNFGPPLLNQALTGLHTQSPLSLDTTTRTPHSFEAFLDSALRMTGTVAILEEQASQVATDFALGRHDDMLAVILAQEMAHTALNFTVQVTSRIVQAYQEIMRMQV